MRKTSLDRDFAPFRRTSSTLQRPPQGATFRPAYSVPARVHSDLRAIERLDHDLRRYQTDEGTAHRLLREALTRNAYGTASIEGNPLTLADVESLLRADPSAPKVTIPDEREILNYAALWRRIDEVPPPRRTTEVRALHAQLFRGVLPAPGRFKTRPNFVGRRETQEVVYVPTAPGRITRELQAALDWVHSAEEHPLVRAAVFFHEFQSIHPFPDGNGRLGRFLTTLLLWHQDYHGLRYAVLDGAFNDDRENYYAKLDEARRKAWDLTPWVAYMTGVLREAYETAAEKFLFRGAVPAGLGDRAQRVAEWFARRDREVPGSRLKFNDVHAAFPQVPRRTLQLDLKHLSEAGLLHREGERKGTAYRWARTLPRTLPRSPSRGSSLGGSEDASRSSARRSTKR